MKLAIALLAVVASAQTNQSVIKKYITNATATNTYTVSNVGQTQHFVFATVTQSGTCASVQSLNLQGSNDNSNWLNIGPTLYLTYGSTNSGTIAGNGFYPYLRLWLVNTSSSCLINAWYIGSVLSYSAPQTTLNTSNYITQAVNIAASGGGTIGTINTVAPMTTGNITIYGLVASQTDVANRYDYEIRASTDGCTTFTGTALRWTLGGTALTPNIVLPTSLVPYLNYSAVKQLCVVGTSTAGTTVGYMTLIYRIEGGS